MITLISLILFVSRLLMMVELKYGPKWRQQRAERWAERDRKRAAKLVAKANAHSSDKEKQPTVAPQS
jgi:hypothetical protein